MNQKVTALLVSAVFITAIIAIVANAQMAYAGKAAKTNGIKFNKNNFSDPLNIDNKYFPLVPGTTFNYHGMTDDIPTTDVFTVTSETKTVDGITARVIHDNAYEDGELVESTDDWFAQDDNGNVWYIGEFTTDIESESHEGSWEAGVHGGKPGIFMEANQMVGDIYQQEFLKGVAEDRAEIVSLTDHVCVEFGCFDNVLVTKETTPLEPDIEEHKFFAPGVGDIQELVVRDGAEESELVSIES
jgi:hypothetical protein